MNPTTPAAWIPIQAAHQLYCQLTGQALTLRFDRERHWFELLRAGFTLEDLRQVITYLQREIRHQRRNVGALKLSNLLQPDHFEEDLNIARVQLRPLPRPPQPTGTPALGPVSAGEAEARRQRCLRQLRQLRERLGRPPACPRSTEQPATHEPSSTDDLAIRSTD
ncbi:MAG: hypothetical protein HS113_07845 [Verrucomicrobiales bacterium]|nr:hypothetical protein [Verrucomicrobiales bacterium]